MSSDYNSTANLYFPTLTEAGKREFFEPVKELLAEDYPDPFLKIEKLIDQSLSPAAKKWFDIKVPILYSVDHYPDLRTALVWHYSGRPAAFLDIYADLVRGLASSPGSNPMVQAICFSWWLVDTMVLSNKLRRMLLSLLGSSAISLRQNDAYVQQITYLVERLANQTSTH